MTKKMPPPAPRYPLGTTPVQSDHGDVHVIQVGRTDGKSITISDLRFIHYKITGRYLDDSDVSAHWFAEEDRI